MTHLRLSLFTLVARIASVAISVFLLSMILSTLTPTPTAFASTHSFASRVQIDASVATFQALSPTEVVVWSNLILWVERAPFGTVPPANRTEVAADVAAYQALSDTQVLVMGTDRNLWLEFSPFGNPPPARAHIDGSVETFQAVPGTNAAQIMVKGSDGNLWQEFGPF